jgi:hypothetical protein
MAKGQKRSNRELKKPKAAKAPMETVTSSGFPLKPTLGRSPEAAKKR